MFTLGVEMVGHGGSRAESGRKDRKGTPPTREEEYGWAQLKLEQTIDRMEKYPGDRVMVLAVIRRKRELVEARERLPSKKKAV